MTDFSPQRERKRGNENEKDNIETNAGYIKVILKLVRPVYTKDLEQSAT